MNTQKNGFLISIEGIDGSGKTTLSSSLYSSLSQAPYNKNCLLTQEPSKTSLGKSVRTLLSELTTPISPLSEFLLFAADRAEHFNTIVLPALQKNHIVISDRLSDSSLAYQGYGRSIDLSFIRHVNAICMQQRDPDVTIYVKVDMKTAFQRIHERKQALSSFEQETQSFFTKVINGFEKLFEKRENCIIVDGTLSMPEVLGETLKKLQPLLP